MKKMNLLVLILLQFGFYAYAKKAAEPTKIAPAAVVSTDKTTPTPADPSITDKISEISFEDVNVSSYSSLYYQGKATDLKMVNHGIRKKKVFGLATVKVYVLEFFAADPSKLDKTEDGILTSLKKAGAVELKLTMSRDLSGKKITDSFKEALEHNGLDINNLSKEMLELMAELSSVKEFQKGQAFSLLAMWKDTTATLLIKRPDGSIKAITGNEVFVMDLFAIWFGKPADDKLADLKKTLIK
ncbi:MAG: chalcone isomerase family protein [Bdellovibrionaceae bacterium]|nr:chalcone isomerase family protein [Pseudobdellovibrionaceae bacterium]